MTAMQWMPAVLLLSGCATAQSSHEPEEFPQSKTVMSTPEKSEPGIERDLIYAPGNPSALDLFLPASGKGEPLVVFVHGGAWQSGARSEYEPICREFQKKGIAAATIDYRLSPKVTHPAHAEDSAAAIAWLRSQAKKYGYNPAKIFIVGHSAGGHIAATIATNAKLLAEAKPAGFVGLEGIYDLPHLAKRWPAYPSWFLNKAFGEDEAAWPAASPTRLKVLSKAPWLLVHSKGDELVDLAQTNDFAAHLQKAGVHVRIVHPEGKTHEGVVQSLSKPNDDVAAEILAFVEHPGK